MAAAGAHRSRHPERTVLYRVLAQYFERFLQVYDEHFAPEHGPLPPGAQRAAEEPLEDVPHRQLVFTIPKRLRVYFRSDRTLLGDLAACAWRSLRLWIRATLGDDTALPGAIGFIQTAGELLNFHPHLHLMITDGVLEPGGSFERLPYPDARQLERLFRPSYFACCWTGA